jgi:ATP-dependent DNA helicase RecG
MAGLQTLKGVGGRVEELLVRLLAKPFGAPRVADLIWHLPSGYVDRRQSPPLAEAVPGGVVTVRVVAKKYRLPGPGVAGAPLRVLCEDDTGDLDVVFFHGDRRNVQRLLPLGETRILSGRLDRYGERLQMTHPDYILSEAQRGELPGIEPLYPLTLGLTQRLLRKLIGQALDRVPVTPEWLDPALVREKGWPSFREALHALHRPQGDADLALWGAARTRLAFDEVFSAQLALQLLRRSQRAQPGRSLVADGVLASKIRRALPYQLTRAQDTALAEIKSDMAMPTRMLRLLQGDVGSGKTVVAALAIAQAVEAGAQAALMAPTDVLARQHLETLQPLCDAAGIRVGYLSGRESGRARSDVLARLAEGEINLLVGTHALFQDDVAFADLGLVVIDEQHRFGVGQRLALQEKARDAAADVLVMTATPIPRTLLLTVHGDIDVSRLTEKPAGRKPIITRAVPFERMDEVIAGLSRAVSERAQVYWVCPAVESGVRQEMAAAEERAAHLRQIFGERVGLVHGQMRGADKDAAIRAFAAGETAILVATTVIEVGVNVPNATVMIVENAEMFGLAQLHQLRGRVGRGAKPSSCILLYRGPLSETAKARLDILRKVDDGFIIAEEDLRLRGGGETLGARQSGDPGFRLAPWPQAADLIELANTQARYLLSRDAELRGEAGRAVRLCLAMFERGDAVKLVQAA